MKLIFTLLAILCFLANPLSAQFEKGEFLISGDAGLIGGGVISDNPRGEASIETGDFGYFLSDNWMIGGNVAANLYQNYSTYRLSVLARRYFTTKSKLRPFIQLGAGYNRGYDGLAEGTFLEAGVGASYEISEGLSLTALATYGALARRNGFGNLNIILNANLSRFKMGQTEPGLRKGGWWANADVGNIQFSHRGSGGRRLPFALVDLRLRAGYILGKRFMLDGALKIYHSDFNYGSRGERRYTDVSGHAGLRYFILKDRRFLPYVGFGATLAHRSSQATVSNVSSDESNLFFDLDLKAGFLYQLSDRIALDARVMPTYITRGGVELRGDVGLQVRLGR